MHRNQFLSFIENPKHAPWHTDVFSPLLAQFPYCQTLHMMYAKHLHYVEHFNYQQQLKHTAAYAGNRSVLHALINDTTNRPFAKSAATTFEQENKSTIEVFTQDPSNNQNDDLVLDEIPNTTAHAFAATNETIHWSESNDLQTADLPANNNLFNTDEAAEETQATFFDAQTTDEPESTLALKTTSLDAHNQVAEQDLSVEVDLKNEIDVEIEAKSDEAIIDANLHIETAVIRLEAEENSISSETLINSESENIENETAVILKDVSFNDDAKIEEAVNSDIHPQHLHDIIEARLAELAPIEVLVNQTETIEVAAHFESDTSTLLQNQLADKEVETNLTSQSIDSIDEETFVQAETNFEIHSIELIDAATDANKMVTEVKEENGNEISDGTENLTTQNVSEKHTFGQWLKQLKKDSHVGEVHAQEPLVPFKTNINSSTELIESVENILADTANTNNFEPKTDSKNSVNQLIEKFIVAQPRIEPQKSNFYSPSVAARNSVMFNDSVVSETLALIFEKQQLYQKAINAYEKLSLMFPEKSDLFAARISVLKQKKGNSH